MFYWSAFLVGFLGSFHCAGMCGPLALALPVDHSSRMNIISGRLLYNGGRILTYSSLGLIAGLIGHSLSLAGFQKYLSIASGALILFIAGGSLFHTRIRPLNNVLVRITSSLKKLFRRFFAVRSHGALFLIGTVNGLLPCGFVYVALAAALTAGSATGSVGYMALFGLGTLPMMLMLSLSGNFFGLKFNRFLSKATPYVAALIAVLLIARGINMSAHPSCHH